MNKFLSVSLIFLLAGGLLSCARQQLRHQEQSSPCLDLTPAFGGRNLPVDAVARVGDRYLLADAEGDRLLSVDDRGQLLRSWSSFEESSIPVKEPVFLARADESSAVVFQKETGLIAKIDSEGRLQTTSTLSDFFGFALASSEQVWVGRPWSGALINVCDLAGRELGKFGSLKSLEESYPKVSDVKSIHPRLRDPFLFLNLVDLESDDAGGAFATFRFSPIVQHYNQRGELLWETRLEGEEIQELGDMYLHEPAEAENPAARMSVAGFTANLVTLGAAYDSARSLLLVLLPDQNIVLLDEYGHQGPTLSPRFLNEGPEPFQYLLALHSVGPGRILFTNPILQRSWVADLPKSLEFPSGE